MVENASTLALGTLGLAVILVALTPLWKALAGPFVVLIEQAGHALALFLSLRWVKGVHLERGKDDPYGHTYRVDPDKDRFKPALILYHLAGYSAPPLAGLVLARGVDRGWDPTGVLLTLFVVLAVLAVFHSDGYTLLVIGSFAVALLALYWAATDQARWFVVVLLSWILLVGATRRGVYLVESRKDASTDPVALQKETGISQDVWIAWFLFVAVASLIVGARWLLQSA